MKIIHITDIHLTCKGELVLDKDPYENFKSCLTHVYEHHKDAAMCVITGDLTHWSEDGAYKLLKDSLDDFPLETRLLIGNHDRREKFLNIFSDSPKDPHGYIQWFEKTEKGLLIYLDTVEAGTHAGHFGEDRQAWLHNVLETHGTQEDVYIFMHHNPVPVGLPSTDMIGLRHTNEFRQLLLGYKNNVKYIFHGHCHMPLSGTISGIPFCGIRGTNHHSWQDFSASPTLKQADLTPVYNVILLQNNDCIIHTIDFSYKGPITEFGTSFEDWEK